MHLALIHQKAGLMNSRPVFFFPLQSSALLLMAVHSGLQMGEIN